METYRINLDLYCPVVFCVMIFVYGFFSSSTPDSYGLAEAIIGLMLVLLVGYRRIFWLLSIADIGATKSVGVRVPIYVVFSLIYLLLVPTITGLFVSGNELTDYVRDIIPLLYFFLPVLVLHRMVRFPERWLLVVITSLCLIGTLFAIRHFVESDSSMADVGQTLIFGTSAYFAQDPAVQFTGAFLICFGALSLMQGQYVRAFISLFLAIFPWAAMFGIIARAPTILAFVALSATIIYYLIHARNRMQSIIFLLLATVLFLAIFYEQVLVIFDGVLRLLLEKQEKHGLSSRDLEMKAVLDNVDSVRILLFGEGWGGLMANPTGGGAKYRWVHNMFGYFFLKAGLFGFLALAFYMWWYVRYVFEILSMKISAIYLSILAALFVPLTINIILEPGYKTLPFGFLLLLIPLLRQVCVQKNGMRAAYTHASTVDGKSSTLKLS